MRKYITIVSLCLSVFLMSCDNYLDLVPKGESVLNTTDDYLGLVESMASEYPTGDFWYFSGDATWPYKMRLKIINTRCVRSLFCGMKQKGYDNNIL